MTELSKSLQKPREDISRVCAEFTSSWESALKGGGEHPSVEPFLARVSEADRPELLRKLNEIHQTFCKRASPAGIWLGGTIDQEANTPPPDCSATVDSVRSAKNDIPSYDPSATLDHVSKSTPLKGPPGTPDLPNTDFSLDEAVTPSSKASLVQVPGYEIVGELGRGGMGVVYKARQVGLNRWVALKMVLAAAHASEHQLARFLTEAKAVADLQHPNIVQIYENGEHDGLPFFSLEFVGGGSLDAKVHRKAQPPREAAHMVETLAEAMQYAHDHGVIHRDLKPANILLTVDGIPKITDFGLAKRLAEDSGQTKSGTLMGTPNYMAPEQARGEVQSVGPLADVYTLGAILYELLAGRPPFQGSTVLETVKQVTNDEPVPPSRLQPQVPRDLETICLKCLQKDMGKRYGSARLLADDLRRFLSDEPILARPVSNWERLTRWCRRNPRVAALVGTVALLLLVVAGGSVGFAYQISREMAETERQKKNAEKSAIAEKLAHKEAVLNEEAAKKNAEEAKKAQVLAGEQADLALDSLYEVITAMDRKLLPISELGPLRKELIDLAMSKLDRVSKNAANSKRADRMMGIALQRMARFYEQRGETERQIQAIERSLQIFDRLMVEQPEVDWNKFNAAISHEALGEIGRESWADPAKIIFHYDRCLEMRQDLVADGRTIEPDIFLRQQGLAFSYGNRAGLALEMGDPSEALKCAQGALTHSKATVALDPKKDYDRRELLSASYYFLGRASLRLGQPKDAEAHLKNSLALRQEWLDANPTFGKAKQELGRTLQALGELETEQRHYPAASEYYQKSLSAFKELLKRAPNVPELEWYEANVLYDLGVVESMLGEDKKAEAHFQACLKNRIVQLQADKNNLQRKVELFLVQARLGMHQEAAKGARDMIETAPKHPGKLFSAACGLGLCIPAVAQSKKPETTIADMRALQQKYADKAIEALREAIRNGFKDKLALETMPDLEPLKKYDGYQELLNQVAKR
jgi:serine/threonine-protein kinase